MASICMIYFGSVVEWFLHLHYYYTTLLLVLLHYSYIYIITIFIVWGATLLNKYLKVILLASLISGITISLQVLQNW